MWRKSHSTTCFDFSFIVIARHAYTEQRGSREHGDQFHGRQCDLSEPDTKTWLAWAMMRGGWVPPALMLGSKSVEGRIVRYFRRETNQTRSRESILTSGFIEFELDCHTGNDGPYFWLQDMAVSHRCIGQTSEDQWFRLTGMSLSSHTRRRQRLARMRVPVSDY